MTSPAAVVAEPGPAADRPRAACRRLLDAYLYGNTVVITLLALMLALVTGAILIVAADQPTRTALGYFFSGPGSAFSAGWRAISANYSALFRGSVFNTNSLYSNSGIPVLGPISETLTNATPLILGGLSVGVAFRAGLFNIGGQGQLIAGAIAAGYVGFAWNLPPFVHVVVAVVAGIIGGAGWGAVVGLLKARTGAHEVITTIMLNYIALYLLDYLLSVSGFQAPTSQQAISRTVRANARLPHLLGGNLRVSAGLLIALAAAAGCWWLLSRSTLGFRLRAVGANPNAARTAGIRVERNVVIVMTIAGALAGLAGVTQILGTTTNYTLTGDVDANVGFDAITVALLGRAKPGGTVLAGLLFGALRAGSVEMSASAQTSPYIVAVMQSVIVLFIAAPSLVRSIFRLRASRAGGTQELAKGWNG